MGQHAARRGYRSQRGGGSGGAAKPGWLGAVGLKPGVWARAAGQAASQLSSSIPQKRSRNLSIRGHNAKAGI